MKAAKYFGKERIEILDLPKPVPEPGEVLVKITYCGICGSDLEAYKEGTFPIPVVLGHELAGVIEEVGSDIENWKIGDRVAIDAILPCGECYSCKNGDTNLCYEVMTGIGYGRNGGFSEYVSAPTSALIALPDSIPDEHITVFDPLAVAILAIRLSNIKNGDSAVVIGLGTIGQFVMQLLKNVGVGKLMVVEKNKTRLEVAKKFNPDIAMRKISRAKIMGATNRVGADFIFECTGVPAVINATSSIVRKGGTLVQVGVANRPFSFSFLPFIMNQNRIQCSSAYLRRDFEHAIDLVARKAIDCNPIVTRIVSLDDIIEEGFKNGLNPETSDIKIIVKP